MPIKRDKALKRVNMNIPVALLERIDAYADSNYVTRSAIMCRACDDFLRAKEAQLLFSSLSAALQKLSAISSDSLDDETKAQLEEIEKLSQMLSGSMK